MNYEIPNYEFDSKLKRKFNCRKASFSQIQRVLQAKIATTLFVIIHHFKRFNSLQENPFS
jgi:hypothetical protein